MTPWNARHRGRTPCCRRRIPSRTESGLPTGAGGPLRTDGHWKRPAAALAGHGAAWAAIRHRGGTPAPYASTWASANEPPTMPLISALHGSGHEVLLPVCEPDRELSWVFWTPGHRVSNAAGTRPSWNPPGPRHGPRGGLRRGRRSSFPPLPWTSPATGSARVAATTTPSWGHLAAAGKEIPLAAVIYDDELLPAGRIPAEEFDRTVPAVLTAVRVPVACRLADVSPVRSPGAVIELALRPCDC